MEKSFLFHLPCFLLFFILLTISGVHTTFICGDENFPLNTTYGENLDALLPTLESNVIRERGFYNASRGGVYALALCRKHYEEKACRRCVDRASRNLLTQCQGKTEAYHWDSENDANVSCLVRYSNVQKFGELKLEQVGNVPHSSLPPSSNLTRISLEFSAMANRTVEVASTADESSVLKYYEVSSAEFTDTPEVYMLMQCTPDLSSSDCNLCLRENVRYNQEHNRDRVGGTVSRPSCFFRWDLYRFVGAFDNLERVSAPPRPPQPREDSRVKKKGRIFQPWSVVVVVVPTFINLSVFVAFVLAYHRMRRRIYAEINKNSDSDGQSMLSFDLGMILIATDEFSPENKLGQGGFGSVYKGILPSGQDIAVKRLARGSGQGELEFKNEVLLLTRLQHRNLVKLLGFCNEGNEEILVYEHVPNSSLDHFIFDEDKRWLLTWDVRYRIIEGVARGLLYLHEDSQLRIIHRDLKASNILLDAEMNPKVADFGMARLFNMDETRGETSRVVGTYGYMAPEYVRHGQFSAKSDVYSFGVMLLEIISGEKNKNFEAEGLPAFAWKRWIEGEPKSIIDPYLNENPRNEIIKLIQIGLLCVQENAAKRPTMNTVIVWLARDGTLTIPKPTEAAFVTLPLSVKPADISMNNLEDKDPFSVDDVSITALYPR
ncbi:PREDICTED: cysteine-rich receptor-like protein kinase 36 [Camelina sativa]|uniref:Cysteine-rich receptor-like protein kinase 36 n=1 Tax=Camelina sativa TaxID=90675 RepID=A0ABM0TX83_CAMSA|nr:PREDICTED: cysteine-rich receptor-like protein kinase 36 [Camelina sativa]